MMRRSQSRRKGAAMVESALVLMMFLVTLIGIFDFGHMLYLHQALVNQARFGARYGSINYNNLTAIQDMVVFETTTPTDRTAKGFMGLRTSMVNVTRSGQNTSDDRIDITITGYSFPMFSPWIARAQAMATIKASASVESP